MQCKRKQTQSSDTSKAAKRVLRSNTTLEIVIAEKDAAKSIREMTIALGGLSTTGAVFGMLPKELGFHSKQCIGASLIANHFVIMLCFRAKKNVSCKSN